MPVYNGENTIVFAIESVLNQSFENFELIICNDASNDSTKQLLSEIVDSRVYVVENISNLGEGLSRDVAIRHAKGEWLAFIDADDAWVQDRLKIMVDLASQVGEAFIFDNIIECHSSKGGLQPWRVIRPQYEFSGCGKKVVKVTLEQLIFAKRSLIKPLIPLQIVRDFSICHSPSKYAADMEFFLRVLSCKNIGIWYLSLPMYLYRLTPGSASTNSNRFNLYIKVLQESMKYFPYSPNIRFALQKKIAVIQNEEHYFEFVKAIKSLHLFKGLIFLKVYPWVVVEFLKRIGGSVFYHFHRLSRGGQVRGIF